MLVVSAYGNRCGRTSGRSAGFHGIIPSQCTRSRSCLVSRCWIVLPPRTAKMSAGRDFSMRLKVLALGAAFSLAASAAMGQDKTFELKIAHWVPPSHPLQKALEDWGSSVEKASNGTIKYKVYPSQQLGKAFDHYDMARDGIADLTYVNPG